MGKKILFALVILLAAGAVLAGNEQGGGCP